MRRTSVSLPTKHAAHDPHEKTDRYLPSHRRKGPLASMKDTMLSQAQKSRWLKTGALVLILMCLFYWLSPTGVEVYNKSPLGEASDIKSPDNVPATNAPPANHGAAAAGNGAPNSGQAPADSSYGTDKCSKSYSKDKPIVQYVLMIDAGSTGSRIHVYKFNNCGPIPELEKEEFKMTEKSVGGLSAFKNDPVAAAKSLDPLMAVAMEHVPDALKKCSPVAVKATAGLRLIGKELADAILAEVRRHLEQDYPFPVVSAEQNGVAIMDGSDEGVYAWITTNYLLGKIGGPDKSETAAVFDLGGGSTQIVFEPTFKDAADGGMPEKLAPGDHKYELDFGGHKFDLYQHSHLGYGLMSARKALHSALIDDLAKAKGDDQTWMNAPIVHPCIAPGTTKQIDVEVNGGEARSFNFTGPSQPSPAQCRNLAEKILKKDAECALAPCSFNGVHQPALAKTFAKEDVYIFSYFYDRTKPLGMPDSFTLREMHDLTQKVCAGKEAWDVFSSVPGALEELEDRPEHCLDLNFMVALLHTGYEMPIDREVKVAKKIKGNELGWCLGASLPLLAPGSGWSCKIKEVS
ncbi:GDA1/CD39 family domain-containing protein [Trichoderma longibrachiatum]|uniref:guanosine-diphosphatase n=1 Tax=Trichoderma longibrachiatum ATCC 18648 TaxID=983965 RepID=A0A2T4CAE1_TRILO|nr:guanosine diphosphatase [Trichoderma longibrachiatum ATCC 18648]